MVEAYQNKYVLLKSLRLVQLDLFGLPIVGVLSLGRCSFY